MRPGLTTIGDYRTLIAITQAYYGGLTLAVAEDGEHQGKVVTLRTLSLGSDASDAISAEIVAAAQASRTAAHDHIVPVLDVVRYEDITLVNAHVDGAPLHILARMLMAGREPPEVGVLSRLAADVLDALRYLHARPGYRAGGLTPQCLWVGSDGRTRVHEPMIQGRLGAIPMLGGNHERMAYRAPEEIRASAKPDARSDLFSVGVVLWELLQRKRLFAGFDATAIAEKIIGSDAPRLQGDDIPGELASVVAKALARTPAERYPDAAAMRAALSGAVRAMANHAAVGALVEKLLGGHPSVQRVRAAAAKHGGATASTPAPAASKARRRALPTPARPLTVPLRVKPPTRKPAVTDDEVSDDSYEPSRDSIAELDALLDASMKPTAPDDTGASDEPPPSTDSMAPPDSVPPHMPTEDEVEKGARRQVGRCELFVEIAHGGMATIYLGRWIGAGGFSKLVAVKAMHPQYTRNPEFVSMFLDEARVVARVRHPNVMPTIDLVEADGDLFIVMDYAKGVTLAHLMRQMKRKSTEIPVPIAVRVVHGVLQGLHAAHEATDERGKAMGVVHRDVTPSNVLVGADGYPRLIDFGIVRALGRVTNTDAGQLKGKPGYLSPEQVLGEEVDRQTDVYSAAVMLWQALTGRRPYKGDNLAAVGHQILTRKVPPPSSLRPGISRELDQVVMKGMARQREDRWATAEEMADALRRAGGLASHRDVSAWVRTVARERLEQAEAVLRAVENAPLTLADEELEEPLSVRAADRQSFTHDVIFAARQLGGEEASKAGAARGAEPVTQVTSHTSVPSQPPPSKRGVYLGAAAAAVVLLAAAIYGLSGSSEKPATAAPSASTASAPPAEPTPSPAESAPLGAATTSEAAPLASASAEPSAAASVPPPWRSATPGGRWPPKAPPPPTAATKKLPEGI